MTFLIRTLCPCLAGPPSMRAPPRPATTLDVAWKIASKSVTRPVQPQRQGSARAALEEHSRVFRQRLESSPTNLT
eukprot:4644705-Pleurochrysis_carterae.AAC.1